MLRTAPPDGIENVHVQAFDKLTPAQLDILFEGLTADAPHLCNDRPTRDLQRSLGRQHWSRSASPVLSHGSSRQTRAAFRRRGHIRRILEL